MSKIKISLADDHLLLRTALVDLINGFESCKVIHDCSNGAELVSSIKQGIIPDIVVLDMNMPIKTGYETTLWLKEHAPQVKVVVLTMYDSELSMIKFVNIGAKGYLKKDIHPSEFKLALESTHTTGHYYSNLATGRLLNLFKEKPDGSLGIINALLTEQEIQFLKLACSDMTYKEVAAAMNLNPRAVDALRDQLFSKLDVKSRVGLAIIAILNGITTL